MSIWNVTRVWNTVHRCELTCQSSHGRNALRMATMAIHTCVQDPNKTNKKEQQKRRKWKGIDNVRILCIAALMSRGWFISMGRLPTLTRSPRYTDISTHFSHSFNGSRGNIRSAIKASSTFEGHTLAIGTIVSVLPSVVQFACTNESNMITQLWMNEI